MLFLLSCALLSLQLCLILPLGMLCLSACSRMFVIMVFAMCTFVGDSGPKRRSLHAVGLRRPTNRPNCVYPPAPRDGGPINDNLSPLLFALFINDFTNYVSKSYKGVDIANTCYPSLHDEDIVLLKLFVLLYADDTIILSENIWIIVCNCDIFLYIL